MRENKFRGKIIGSNTGHYELDYAFGNLVKELETGKTFICDLSHFGENTKLKDVLIEVRPETVGQYTGMNDINNIEIYEGDIVEILLMKNKYIGKIIYNDKMACFEVRVKHTDGHINSYIIGHIHSIKVIGNIYESPELLQN